MVFGPGIELRPNLAPVGVESRQCPANPRNVEQAGVGDQYEFHVVEAVPAAHLGAYGDDPIEVGVCRRLAVAA